MATRSEDVEGAIRRLSDDAWHLAANRGRLAKFGTPLSPNRERWNEAFASDICTILASHAAQAERIASLETNLNGRDDFIVGRGLWSDFVDQLPSGKASA